MDTNADDHRDMSERGEKKCSDTIEGLISAEEEPWQVGRPNRESMAMDTEADNTNMPRRKDSDLQLGMGKEDEAPVSGLSNMDRESTGTIGSEMESVLSTGLDVPSDDRYPQSGTDSMKGKKTGGQQYAIVDANMTTGDSNEGVERQEQAVKEQEASEPETRLEADSEKNTATYGVHENRNPETEGDRQTKPSSAERRRKSNDVGQGAQPLAPVEIANNIAEKYYVSKTLALLSPPKYNQFTSIVSAYDVDITGQDFARLQIDTKLNDGNIDWMMRWWAGQVNGRFGEKPSPPPSNSHAPRCYFASTY